MKIIPRYYTNKYWLKQHPIKAIVIHKTEGNLSGDFNWIEQSTHPRSNVSYHIEIAKNGDIYGLVSLGCSAWHAGKVSNPTWKGITAENPNYYTIGVALEGYANEPTPIKQQLSLWKLLAELTSIFKLEINDQIIVFHREITDQKKCPGNLSKSQIIFMAKLCRRLGLK